MITYSDPLFLKHNSILVFMSPGNATSPWKQLYKQEYFKEQLVLIAFDERHCIQEWSVTIL